MIDSRKLTDLQKVRDQLPRASRLTMAGALVHETYHLFRTLPEIMDPGVVREAIIDRNLLHKNSHNRRRVIWLAIYHRYLNPAPQWVGPAMVQAVAYGSHSPEFLSLAYLYFTLRDRFTFECVTGFIWPMWQKGITRLTHRDVMRFMLDLADEDPVVRAWRESTKKNLASTLLSSLRDFGLLKGTATKMIQRPPVALETAYHLLCILWAEGKSGREIIAAPDWRLFLWSDSDIIQALTVLDQQGRVQFEKSGQTVMLQLLDAGGETA